MKKINRRIIIILSFVFIVSLSYGIMKFLIAQKEPPPAFKPAQSKRFVNVEVIEYDNINSPVLEDGRMLSTSQVILSAEASGKIEQGDIMLKEGARFNKGQVLFKIYSDEYELALKARKSNFLNALAMMLPDIAIDFAEYEDVFNTFFSSIDMDKPLPEFPVVKDEKLQIYLAGKNILSEYYNIKKDQLQLSRHVTRAQFNGTLTDVFLEVGAYTNTGGRIAEAIGIEHLELEVPMRRSDAFWVNIGDPVEITSDKHDISWKGTVVRKEMVIEENTQSQSVYVGIHNTLQNPLLPGEWLTASFGGRPVENVMEIPRRAVFNYNEVFIVKDNRLTKEIINIVKINTNTLLFNGPAEGDTIVVQSLINVHEGTAVTTSLDQLPKGPGKKPGNSGDGNKK